MCKSVQRTSSTGHRSPYHPEAMFDMPLSARIARSLGVSLGFACSSGLGRMSRTSRCDEAVVCNFKPALARPTLIGIPSLVRVFLSWPYSFFATNDGFSARLWPIPLRVFQVSVSAVCRALTVGVNRALFGSGGPGA